MGSFALWIVIHSGWFRLVAVIGFVVFTVGAISWFAGRRDSDS